MVLALDDSSGELIDETEIVCGHYHGSSLTGYIVKTVDNGFAGGRVEIACRFIRENYARMVEEGAGYDYALLLAS